MKGTFLLFSGLQIFSVTAFGQCIDTKDPSIPACPIGKTQALDDRYPAAYVTVGPGQGNDQLGFDFAKKAFAAGKPTKIVLSGWKVEQSDSLKESLKKSGFTDDEIKQRLIHFDTGTSYQWQQDFVQPEFNPATGAPEMRPINSYLSRRTSVTDDQQYFSQLANKLNDALTFNRYHHILKDLYADFLPLNLDTDRVIRAMNQDKKNTTGLANIIVPGPDGLFKNKYNTTDEFWHQCKELIESL